jgi:hypothetical protein
MAASDLYTRTEPFPRRVRKPLPETVYRFGKGDSGKAVRVKVFQIPAQLHPWLTSACGFGMPLYEM